MPELTVIIPTINEANLLPALLADLKAQQGVNLEIIIGDGGSSDDTRALARRMGARAIQAPRGRGTQMNRAASQARGAYVLFLHADSRLTDPRLLQGALNALQTAMKTSPDGAVAGHFALRFQLSHQDTSRAYGFLEAKTHLNRTNTTNGDQGFLLSRHFFFQLGGFSEDLIFLEDQQLAEKIRRQGHWITLPGTLITSARRFENQGFRATYLLMSLIMGAYTTGLTPFFTRLPDAYRSARRQGEGSGRLWLTPYFKTIRVMQRKDLQGWNKIRAWYRIGGYIRSNIWQLFFYLDTRIHPQTAPSHHPCLNFHDRRLAPYFANPFMDGATALACYIWLFGLVMPYFQWIECRQRKKEDRI